MHRSALSILLSTHLLGCGLLGGSVGQTEINIHAADKEVMRFLNTACGISCNGKEIRNGSAGLEQVKAQSEKKDVFVDDWGNPLIFQTTSSGKRHQWTLTSYGADGKAGGTGKEADISVSGAFGR